MSNAFVVRCLMSIGIVLTTASALPAEDAEWARAMFDKEMLNINYKSVAKGQDVYFKLRVTNIYKEEMHITGLSTSCGCLLWDENKPGPNGFFVPIVIPSGQERTLTLRLDTIRHHGEKKGTNATVTFYEPSKGQVGSATILAEGYIRTDVVLQPGSVNFGSVDPNKGAEQRLTVNYAGRNDWSLVSVKFNSPFLAAVVVEKSRGNGLVSYELVVKLKETVPIGQIRDQMMLVTNDANNPQIPVHVEAKIEPEIVVADVQFGQVVPGQPKTQNVVVRGKKPFKIEKFERTKSGDSIKMKKSNDFKPVHQLTLTLTPPNEPGLFEEEFFLTISGRAEPITFKARGRILEAPADSESKK